MRLYHYRSMEAARAEIGNGTFKYSYRDELNDPLEGHMAVYWQGDRPAWEGLFRNYICSLWAEIINYLLKQTADELAQQAVFPDIHAMDEVPMGTLLKKVGDAFLAGKSLDVLLDCIAEDETELSEKRLRLILQLYHEEALRICIQTMVENKLMPEKDAERVLLSKKVELPTEKTVLKQLLQDGLLGFVQDSLEDCNEAAVLSAEEAMEKEDEALIEQMRSWMSIRIRFPQLYTKRLLEILYPKSFVVCFSADCTNSAMWGNYAQNHTGVCLIYETKRVGNRETLRVKTSESYSSRDETLTRHYRDDTVKPVVYGKPAVRRNFFTSLGRMNAGQIHSWLANGAKKRSKYEEMYYDETWREQYWKDGEEKDFTKLPDWSYEKEWRLRMIDFLWEHDDKERYIPYDPEQLKGVIFGIRTKEADKQSIIAKLRKQGRNLEEIEFYQAEYDNKEQKIVLRKKDFRFIK